MKFTIATQELNYLINAIQNVVPQKPTIPILANILLEAVNDELILTATDLTVSIRCYTETQILEEGATTIPSKKFAQLIRELTAPTVEISSNSNEVTTIIAGSSRFKLNGMSRNEFPTLTDLSGAHTFFIKQKEFKDLLYNTSFAVSKEDSRYTLTGLLMDISEGHTTFVGTDGKRLALAQTPSAVDAGYASRSIIPLKAVDEILKTLLEEDEVKISLLDDKIAIEANQILVLTKLIAGEYPDYASVIPAQTDLAMTLHREELITLLRQISLFLSDQNSSVRFAFSEGELRLTANSLDIGEGLVSMPVNYSGPKLEIAFNPSNFIDILRHCKEEVVTLGLIDAYNPGIITEGNEPGKFGQSSPLFVIMPMRLAED